MKSKLAVLVSLALVSNYTLAVEPQAIQTSSGFDLTPLLTAGFKFDDNIASTSANETDSSIMTVIPTIEARRDDGVSITQLTAGLYHGQYFGNSEDDYTDATLGGSFESRISEQSLFTIKSDLVWAHEDRGTGVTEGLGDLEEEPALFNTQTVSGFYEYGLKSTPTRIRTVAKYFNKEYTNLEETTQYRNYDSVLGGLNFYYDTQSGAAAVLEASIDDISYDFLDPSAPRDNKNTVIKTGAEWEISAVTTGELKIGYQKKDFADAQREDFSGLAWLVNVNWTPLTYSEFNVGTGRRAKDPLQGGDYIRETSFLLGWTHDWSEFVSTNLNYNRTEEDYVGLVRTDKVNAYNFSVTYAFRRFIDVSFFTSLTDKTSTIPTIKFDRNIVGVNFDFSL